MLKAFSSKLDSLVENTSINNQTNALKQEEQQAEATAEAEEKLNKTLTDRQVASLKGQVTRVANEIAGNDKLDTSQYTDIVASGIVKNCVLNIFVFAAEVEVESKLGDDAVVSFLDLVVMCIDFLCRSSGANKLKEGVKHICNLRVAGISLSGCGGNNVSAVGVCLDDVGNHSEMLGVCQRRAAEFNYFQAHNLSAFLRIAH